MELTHSQISEILSNYTSSSEGFVSLQSLIMNSLMFHERELFVSGNAHEQCNGFRSRRWYSHGFEFSLRIPRSRSGNFYPVLLGLIRNESEERARLFNLLYTKGLTTEQIGEISDCVYGRAYSSRCRILPAAAVMTSNGGSAAACPPTTWPSTLMPPLSPPAGTGRYPRRLTIPFWGYWRTAAGRCSRLSITPPRVPLCWKDELEALRQRGVGQIDLVVSDALQGIENAVCAAFPGAAHQFCVAHVKRQILGSVSHKDKPAVALQLSEVFPLKNNEMKSFEGYEEFITFVEKWESKVPCLEKVQGRAQQCLLHVHGLPSPSAEVHIYDQLD